MSDAPWYGEGLKFRCQTDCGNCCKGPQPGWAYVTEEEATRIAEFLNMTPDAFGKRHLRLLESGLCLGAAPGGRLWAVQLGDRIELRDASDPTAPGTVLEGVTGLRWLPPQ